ncbi:MAG: PDZ domain-containing protein [Planctomycetes bacterium]|jgi:type II secretory pathway component PulC|nr:PDZ domain-containing protein [Planctomycetota bacterium]
MSVRGLKFLLLVLNVLAAAGVAAAGAVFFASFLRQEPPKRQRSTLPAVRKNELPAGSQPISHYAPIWRMRALPSDNQAPVVQEVVKPLSDPDRVREILRGLFSILGTVCNTTRPASSIAVLNLLRENRAETVKAGDFVSGARVDEIRRGEVLFTYQGVSGVDLPMGTGGTAVVPPRAPGARGGPPPGTVDATAGPVEVKPGQPLPFTSKPVGPNHWEIDRREVQYIQTNQSKIIDDLRPVPEIGKDGKQEGVKVQNIPSDSLAAQRGLQQGDIIKAVNNVPVDSMDFASIGKKIGNAKTLVITVERRGRLMNFTYTVR